MLFFLTNGELWGTICLGTSAFDLGKDEGTALPRYNIDLTEDASVIALNDPVTAIGKVSRSQILSSLACVFSLQRHGFLSI